MNPNPKILLIEDDPSICDMTKMNLNMNGYQQVCCASDGMSGLELAARIVPDLILLDVMMGETSGFKMARQLKSRPETAGVPIIFCTARDTEDDTVAGLNIGADDYIAKPFSIREVLARVRSVLRRTAQPAAEEKAVAFEGLRMDLTRKVCTIDGEPLALTKKEFEILALLLSSRGKIFSREEILRQVWSDEVIVLDRTIDVNITRLRRKIGPYGEHIVTRLGYGYGFEE